MQAVHNHGNQARFFQVSHAIAKGTHARKQNFFSIRDNLCIACHHRLCADGPQRILHAVKIAHAIIYNRYFFTHIFSLMLTYNICEATVLYSVS